ncbi:MAG: alpha/beta hydrolase [Firmicutes bacterium]|nr:alpha/beta hydrolase [Bacillota bacterium]
MGRRSRNVSKRAKKSKTRKKTSLKAFLFLIIVILLGIWFLINLVDKEVATTAKVDNEEVDQIISAESKDLDIIESNGYIVKPNFKEPTKGIIIYGAGGISPKAYIPLSIIFAKKGYLVVIPEFLFNSPSISSNTINTIINNNKTVENWVVVGHGSGGEAMSENIKANDKIKGAVFLASYPKESVDLSKSGLKVVSIKGTEDKNINLNLYEERKKLLPIDTMFVQIENGNFSYFANYENISNATITKVEQQIQTSVQILNLMDQIS